MPLTHQNKHCTDNEVEIRCKASIFFKTLLENTFLNTAWHDGDCDSYRKKANQNQNKDNNNNNTFQDSLDSLVPTRSSLSLYLMAEREEHVRIWDPVACVDVLKISR